jgi:hypothetical protein
MFRSLFLATGLLVSLAGAEFARADALTDGIAALPGSVEDVRIGGTWDNGGKSGSYRILVARAVGGENVTARLFVQWIANNDDGTTTVENTIEIKELADLKVDVVDFTAESDTDGLSVFLQTLNPNGSTDANYELFIQSPTDYRFGPASN